jgi:hypothetical protein
VIFSRSECALLWGPPVHPLGGDGDDGKERLRRTYQHVVMRASLRRAAIVIAS